MEIFTNTINVNLKYANSINKICAPIFNLLKISYFSYFSIFPVKKAKQIMLINPSVHILKHYLDNKYYLYDPNIVNPENLQSGFALWSSYDDPEYQGKYMYNMKEKFNINDGVTLIKKSTTACEGFCFGVTRANQRFFTNITVNLILLNQFSNYFINKTTNIISKFSEQAINIAKLKGNKFMSQPGITENCTPKEKEYNHFISGCISKNCQR